MEQRIGYARVSTSDQNPDLQRDALRQAGCDDVYEETASGKSADKAAVSVYAFNHGKYPVKGSGN